MDIIDFLLLQLVKLFKEQQQQETNGHLHQFDHECTIFVCNKWDQVPAKEDKKVWEKIAKNLQSALPTRRTGDITEQMFRLSVKEVSCMQMYINTQSNLVKVVIQLIIFYKSRKTVFKKRQLL